MESLWSKALSFFDRLAYFCSIVLTPDFTDLHGPHYCCNLSVPILNLPFRHRFENRGFQLPDLQGSGLSLPWILSGLQESPAQKRFHPRFSVLSTFRVFENFGRGGCALRRKSLDDPGRCKTTVVFSRTGSDLLSALPSSGNLSSTLMCSSFFHYVSCSLAAYLVFCLVNLY